MSDSEKIELVKAMIGDFWDFNSEENQNKGAMAFIVAIYSVINFGKEK